LISLAATLAASLVAAAPTAASAATDAGVDGVVLDDPRPGEVSLPFTVPITQSGFEPAPEQLRLEIAGFELDPGTATGRWIGSVDFDTDQGFYPGQWLTTGGAEGDDGTYLIEVPFQDPAVARVVQDTGLDASGDPVARDGSTTLTLTFPATLPLGAKLRTLAFRFNVDWETNPTTAVGATNPAQAGDYRIRSWVLAGDDSTNVATETVRVGEPGKELRLIVKSNKDRVKAGKKVTFSLRMNRGPSRKVTVSTGGRKLKTLKKVGSKKPKRFSWRAPRDGINPVQTFRFKPAGADAIERQIEIRR